MRVISSCWKFADFMKGIQPFNQSLGRIRSVDDTVGVGPLRKGERGVGID